LGLDEIGDETGDQPDRETEEAPADAPVDGPPPVSLPGPRAHPSRRTLFVLVAPIVVLVIGGYFANATWPALLRSHPLLLIALDPRNRWLVLVSNKVSVAPFMIVGFVRRVLSDPLFFILGYLYGDRAVRWVERRFAPDTGLVPWMEKNFNKFSPALVFLFPGALVCVLAGAMGMNPWLFAALNVSGTIAILVVLYEFGDVFSGPVGAVTRFFDRNFKLFTAISILLTIYYFWDQRRRGKVQSIKEAEAEIEGGGDSAG
jgi:membrane protein DedA with SNARE-associated domain